MVKTNKTATQEQTTGTKVAHTITVKSAREIKANTFGIDIEINGVQVHGAIFKQGEKDGKEWSLVSFPSYKAENGKYYTHCWCPLDKGDLANIEGQVAKLLS